MLFFFECYLSKYRGYFTGRAPATGFRKEVVRRRRRRTNLREALPPRRGIPRLQRPLAVQLRLNGFERSQGQRSFVLPVLRADQVVHDRVELRLQFPFAEVFDFVSGDELGHVFLLRLWAATIASSMTETQQRVSD